MLSMCCSQVGYHTSRESNFYSLVPPAVIEKLRKGPVDKAIISIQRQLFLFVL